MRVKGKKGSHKKVKAYACWGLCLPEEESQKVRDEKRWTLALPGVGHK